MSGVTILYISTAATSIAIALILARIAKLSARAKVNLENKKAQEGLSSGAPVDESIRQGVYEQVSEYIHSKHSAAQVSKAVSEVFQKELQKRLNSTKEELEKKYNGIIEQKTKSEEFTWKKYKSVLSDKKETDAVIRSIAEGLVVVDSNGKVIMLNPAAEKLLGTSKKDKLGKSILDGLKNEQLVSLVKDSPDKGDKEIEIVSQEDETKKTLRSSSAVIENENGQAIGMVSVLTDVTKQKELDSMKSTFVSNITHELRTPLVAVQKSISLLLTKSAGDISNVQEHFLVVADRNIKRLSLLIDDLLDLSKMEAGKMQLKYETMSIDKVIDEAVENLETWAKTKYVKIVRKIQDGLPEVSIDPNRIIQVLNNLIGNSIKFTPKDGSIAVTVLKDAGNSLQIIVEDTGVGIPKEDIPKIFDRFYQTGERTLTDISGTGIGLAIAKEIVGLHGGKIWAESEHGQGARFIFTLPLNK
ncbi:MAG: ATP-binding protein [Candidatus Omnitrophota bacterium]